METKKFIICFLRKQFKQNIFEFHFVIIWVKFLFSLGTHNFISLLSHEIKFYTFLDLGFQGGKGIMKNFTKWNSHCTFRVTINREFSRMNLIWAIKLFTNILIKNIYFVLGIYENSRNNIIVTVGWGLSRLILTRN